MKDKTKIKITVSIYINSNKETYSDSVWTDNLNYDKEKEKLIAKIEKRILAGVTI